jgi:FixJ family two-component response regulator
LVINFEQSFYFVKTSIGPMTDNVFTIFLVDDDAGVLKALSRLLLARGYTIQSFGSSQMFLANHDASIPGCAILDVSMPDLDGLALQKALTAEGVQRPVIFLTGRGDIPTSVRAMRAGAIDFLTKPVNDDDLCLAIARAEKEDADIRKAQADLNSLNARFALLTAREREVMTHVVAGRLNKQIAGDLGTVEKTVKVHRGRVMSKLGVRSVADLVRLAEKAGISRNGP